MVNRVAASFQISKEFLRCCCQRVHRLHNFYSKAVTVLLEAETVIKRMSILTAEITGQRELIASRIFRQLQSMLHHGPADSTTAILCRYGDILYRRGLLTALGEVIHDQQLVGAHDLAFELRHKHAVTGILAEAL